MQLTVMLAIAANYFTEHRAVAVGAINFCFAIGSIFGAILSGFALTAYRSWRFPMLLFGCFGLLAIVVIALGVKPWFSETQSDSYGRADLRGASTLRNRNTVLLTAMSLIGGLVIYGYLGMYPTFLREGLHFTPRPAGTVMDRFGLGAPASIRGRAV